MITAPPLVDVPYDLDAVRRAYEHHTAENARLLEEARKVQEAKQPELRRRAWTEHGSRLLGLRDILVMYREQPPGVSEDLRLTRAMLRVREGLALNQEEVDRVREWMSWNKQASRSGETLLAKAIFEEGVQ